MTAKELLDFATKNHACQAAIRWLADLPPETTGDEMLQTVPDVGWVGWLINRIDDQSLLARLATMDDCVCHEDGTFTYWSYNEMRWVYRGIGIPNEELIAMALHARRKARIHMEKGKEKE